MKYLFLYDFDGTITKKDTLFGFLKFVSNKNIYYYNYFKFIPIFVLSKLNIFNKGEAKRLFVSSFLKGCYKTELENLSLKYSDYLFKNDLFRERALKSIKYDQKKGDVYIVSASLDIWLEIISKRLNVFLICTKAEFKNSVFTGNFLTPNCNYEEKVLRVLKEIDMNRYHYITYYGDSKGDLPMKKIASKFYYRKFE